MTHLRVEKMAISPGLAQYGVYLGVENIGDNRHAILELLAEMNHRGIGILESENLGTEIEKN